MDIGFLPPEDGTGRGNGYFAYLVKPKPGLPAGSEIRNVARITFDYQETIATNQPTSTFTPVPTSTGPPVPTRTNTPTEMSPRAITLASTRQLGGLLPTGDPRTDQKINVALDHLNRSLAPGLWQDDTHLTNKGEKVFNEQRAAVSKLMEITNRPAPEIAAVIQALVGADQSLAQTAIMDAMAALGEPKEIAKALDEMDKAAREVTKGNFDKAIEHYKHAWQQAQQA